MRKTLMVAAVLALAACDAGEERDSSSAPTQRQADSALGASGLPGARAITGAMNANDSAAARNARNDSLGIEP